MGSLLDFEEATRRSKADLLRSRRVSTCRDFNHLTYLHLIDLALLLAPTHSDIIVQTRDTFNFMIKDVGGKERGPLLASLELEKRLAVEAAVEADRDIAQQGGFPNQAFS